MDDELLTVDDLAACVCQFDQPEEVPVLLINVKENTCGQPQDESDNSVSIHAEIAGRRFDNP